MQSGSQMQPKNGTMASGSQMQPQNGTMASGSQMQPQNGTMASGSQMRPQGKINNFMFKTFQLKKIQRRIIYIVIS